MQRTDQKKEKKSGGKFWKIRKRSLKEEGMAKGTGYAEAHNIQWLWKYSSQWGCSLSNPNETQEFHESRSSCQLKQL